MSKRASSSAGEDVIKLAAPKPSKSSKKAANEVAEKKSVIYIGQ
jgi:hypothetical protein